MNNGWWKSLLSGSIPGIFLAIAAYWALSGTGKQIDLVRDQVELLKEQVSYARNPIIRVYTDPPRQGSDDARHKWRLYISNVGSDTATNVSVNLGLFIVSDSSIYTFNREDSRTGFTDTLRNAKERIWPRLTLAPGDESDFINERFSSLLTPTLINYNPLTYFQNRNKELYGLKNLLKGIYVLMVKYSYRRKSDLSFFADTVFFEYTITHGFTDNLKDDIGGPKTIDRLINYTSNGPNHGITIERDGYQITTDCIDPHDTKAIYLKKK
jgi:hypothetical protein